MRRIIILFAILLLLAIPVSAMDFTAPQAPESAEKYMPEESGSFGEDLWYVLKSAVSQLQPSIADAAGVCVSLIAITMLVSILQSFTGIAKRTVELVGTITVSLLLVQPSNSLIQLGVETIKELCEYEKLLLPVMAGAVAAEGGTTTAAALYAGTATFNTLLTVGISKLVVPMIFFYMALSIASSAIGEEILKKFCDFVKWLMTWCLKITIYLFTGYIGVTGVISGTADAAAVKATKLAISSFVPVVGNIISDASETILVSAGVMKSTAGIYGLVVIIAMWIGPFLQIGIQYLMLKITSSVCSVFGKKESVGLIDAFSGLMGFLLAVTGTVCLLLLISTVCFIKGVSR